MNPHLGLVINTFAADVSFAAMAELGRLAEDLGYDRVYTTESLTDTLAIDMLIALRTERLVVGSFVAIIYHRHPHIAAQAAATISDTTGGRFVLGLGLGHRPRVEAMGLTMGRPVDDLREYVRQVRGILDGEVTYPNLPIQEYQGSRLQFRRPTVRVPVHTAAVGPRMAELAGELSDGVMMHLVPRSGLGAMRDAAARGAARVGRDPGAIEMVLGLHTLVHDDLERARSLARESLAYWVGLPSYNRSLRDAGFDGEAAALREAFQRGDQQSLRANITDEIIDEFCLVGPLERCKERLAAFREAGATHVALQPDPVVEGESYGAAVARTLRAFA